MEYFLNFTKRDNDWIHYNFNCKSIDNIDESSYSDISIGDKDTRWNQTPINISIGRIIITFIYTFGVLIFFEFMKVDTEIISLYILYYIFLPFSLIFFFYFSLGKLIFRKMNLSNECVILLSC